MKSALSLILTLGFMSLSACSHGHHHKKGSMHEKMHQKWEMMDKDGDGAISKDEYTSAKEDKFKKMDANSDGKITKEEKKAYMKQKCGCK